MEDYSQIPGFSDSKAGQYVQSKGWDFRVANDQINIENCPVCGKDNYKFYMAFRGNRDGLWECKRCQKGGTLYQLMVDLGDRDPNVQSSKDWAGQKRPDPLPNVEAHHQQLLMDNDALNYLTDVRGISLEVISKAKLGLKQGVYFGELSREAPAIVIPYLKNGNIVFAKYRSYPPLGKAFSAPSGWEVPLYKEEILVPGLPDVVFVEGEYDQLVAETAGIERVLGVPGAGNKKMLWVDLLDKVAPEKIYICYDSDREGQKGAQALAERIGLDKCYNIVLPDVSYEDNDGNVKKVKDISDWIRYAGGDAEQFEELKRTAGKFNVKGVASAVEALDEMEQELEGKEFERPKYQTNYEELNKKIGGFEDGDVVDILAPGKVGKSTVAIALVDDLVERYGEPGGIICGEMTNKRMARKLMCKLTQTDDSPAIGDEESRKKAERIRAAIPKAKEILRGRKADLYFTNPAIRDLDDLYELVRNMVRRYGVKFLVVDNLQLFCDNTLKNQNNRPIHLSQLSKKLAALAKELGLVLFRIVQPKKMNGHNIASQDDIDGASQIDKDCDLLIALHRNRKAEITADDFESSGGHMDEEDSFEPEMLFSVRLARYAPGGKIVLMFNGSTSSLSSVKRDTSGPAVTPASRSTPFGLPTEGDRPRPSIPSEGMPGSEYTQDATAEVTF